MGSDDKVFSPEFLAAEATRRFAGFQLKHIANAGHWPHLEQPAKVAEALSTFLQEINLSNSESAKQNNALQPVVAEIRDWFFGDYLSTWVAIGSNQKPLDTALEYWGVPMHVASVLQTKWLQTPTEVLAQIEASQAPLKAKGYDHTVVLDSEITVFNPTGACVDALWSRRRADGQELQRVASHFEVHRTNDGWRVVALANRLSESETLAGTSLSWTPEV